MAKKSDRYQQKNTSNPNRIRVRTKRLDQVDTTKLTLAYWLLAKQLVEDKTDTRKLTEPEVRKVMQRLDEHGEAAAQPEQTEGSDD